MERLKWALLIGLWILWALILGLRWTAFSAPARVPLTFVSGQRLQKVDPPIELGFPTIAAWRMGHRSRPLSPTPKNIFVPLSGSQKREHTGPRRTSRPPAPLPPRTASLLRTPAIYVPPAPPPIPAQPSSEEIAAQQARLQSELAVQHARQLMGQYRYLGYLEQQGELRAFLGKGTELYIVRAGEILEGQIYVATIDGAVLKLRDGAGTVEQSLRLMAGGD